MNWRHVEFAKHIWLILIVILDIYAKVHALLDKFYFTYLFNWDVVIQRLFISLHMRMSTFMKNWVHLFWCYFYLYFSVTPTIILKVLYRFAIYYELSIHFYRSLPLCTFLFLFHSTYSYHKINASLFIYFCFYELSLEGSSLFIFAYYKCNYFSFSMIIFLFQFLLVFKL